MLLPLVLNKELRITAELLVDDELPEFESLRWRGLVCADDRVVGRRFVCCFFAVVDVAAAWRSFVRLGVLTDEGSTKQNSRQPHVQLCPISSPIVFIFHIQI